MKYVYLLIVILSLNACQNSSPIKTYQRSEHSKIAERITAKTAQKIENETGLSLMGVGGGMMNQVQMMAMSFQCLGEITMEQGRELVVYCMNEYLSAINASEEIRPHLIHYPFTPADIQIEIFIYSKDGRDAPLGTLCLVCEIDGIVKYKIKEPFPIIHKTVHEETCEVAAKLAESQGSINKIRKKTYHM